jgi:hypothetical protein
MGVFDAIADALSGKPQKPASSPPSNKVIRQQGDEFADLRAARDNEAAAAPVKKSLPSMHDHADALHPVTKGGLRKSSDSGY